MPFCFLIHNLPLGNNKKLLSFAIGCTIHLISHAFTFNTPQLAFLKQYIYYLLFLDIILCGYVFNDYSLDFTNKKNNNNNEIVTKKPTLIVNSKLLQQLHKNKKSKKKSIKKNSNTESSISKPSKNKVNETVKYLGDESLCYEDIIKKEKYQLEDSFSNKSDNASTEQSITTPESREVSPQGEKIEN